MNQKISLVVDGKAALVDADPAMPLLYALRSELGLSNPKFGCGKAQCGACTVHLDGAPVRSCVTPLQAAAGRSVTTLAGLGSAEKPHPLQRAYIEEQVPQCGYCLSGWIMTAAAFLKTNPRPSDAQIREAMGGLKCRCGTHMAIMRAIKRASRTMSA
jgi:nicotinate dehydrogenase subunit A